MKKSKTKYYKLISIMLIFCVALSCDNTTPLKPEQNEIKDTTTINHIRFASGAVDSILMAQRIEEIAKIEHELVWLRLIYREIYTKVSSDSLLSIKDIFYKKFNDLILMRDSWDYPFTELQNTGIPMKKSKDNRIRTFTFLIDATDNEYVYESIIQFLDSKNEIKKEKFYTKSYDNYLNSYTTYNKKQNKGFLDDSGIYGLHVVNIENINHYLLLSKWIKREFGRFEFAQVFCIQNDSLKRIRCFPKNKNYSDVLAIDACWHCNVDLEFDTANMILQHNEIKTTQGFRHPTKNKIKFKFENGKFKKLKDK
ncbi:MAG: hypothetical protein K9J13_02270 [Saprospiraceae bacterium]|nr:hypothetical protein [Saprospiraceae bacterium]